LLCHVGPTAVLVGLGAGLGALVIRPKAKSVGFEAARSVLHRFTDGG